MALLLVDSALADIQMRARHTPNAAHNHHLANTLPLLQNALRKLSIINFGGALGFTYSPQDSFILPGDTIRWTGRLCGAPTGQR